MARYKPVDYAQGQFISVQFEKQILPDSFEYALSFIVDNKLDLKALDESRTNDDAGAPAYDPRVMLKIVLYAYSRGILSSREIAAACQQNVVMMALSANSRPHFTTIAKFIAELGPATKGLFVDVLLYCDELGLIGKEMFAIDGCKFPSNASKEWSGTRADFEKKRDKFKARIERLTSRHKAIDESGKSDPIPGRRGREEKAIAAMEEKAAKLEAWLRDHPEDRQGVKGRIIKSSMTDADSAKMASGRGVIQGYNAVAAVDGKHQVIVGAQAHGNANEPQSMGPMIDEIRDIFGRKGEEDVFKKAKVTADSGFHSEESSKVLFEAGIDGYVPDKGFRRRDAAFNTADRHRSHKALIGRSSKKRELKYFMASEFRLDPETGELICPARKRLRPKDRRFKTTKGYFGIQYKARRADCDACELRTKCLRNQKGGARTVHKFHKRVIPEKPPTFSKMMREKIESELGRYFYGMRMEIVEPVFANLRFMLGLDRFTMRGSPKVNAQWLLFAIVHNLGKIHRFA